MKGKILGYIESLRFPFVLLLAGVLFAVSLLVPDPVPFVDEALLALVTIILSRLRRGRSKEPAEEAPATEERP